MKDLQHILDALAPHADTLDSEALNELGATAQKFHKDLDALREKDRNLCIAVIGQMKSGKSSFLNAALFGRDVLPKAETPMTAALTSIVYSEKSRAEVSFYSADDWAGIERSAFEYDECYQREEARLREQDGGGPFAPPVAPGKAEIERNIDPALKACAELVDKAREHGLQVADYLGRTSVIDDMDDAGQLASALQEYVGSGGRFTAITKMTTLYLNDQRLEGLEVVDTPGFNDPVVSRGAITRNHLARCDVIFFLSPLGQFLGAADMRVFREQLPEAGLGQKAVYLVGTQRDIALRQDGKLVTNAARLAERIEPARREAAKLQAMLQLLERKMGAIANDAFEAQLTRGVADERTRRLLDELRLSPPFFISAWAALTAGQFDRLSADDRTHLERLQQGTGVGFDPERLKLLSNIPALFTEIVGQRSRKQELLAGKEKALSAGRDMTVRRCLDQIKTRLAAQRRQLQQHTIADLERMEQDVVERLARGKLGLEDVFDEQAVNASKAFALLKTELRGLSRTFTVKAIKETKSEAYQEDVSFFKGLFGHTWETRYRNVETVHASVQDAVEQIDRFAHQCVERFEKRITECINLDGLRRNVSKAAMALFDTGSAEFDGDLMLSGINKSLRRIAIPTVDFGSTVFTEKIIKQFGSGRVTADAVETLQQAHRAAIQTVLADIEKLVDRKIAEIESALERSARTFVTDMSRDISASLRKLREQRADREAALAQIERAHVAVERCYTAGK